MTGDIQLEGFQEDAHAALKTMITEPLLAGDEGAVVLLKAPTGSGKTVVAGTVIAALADDDALDVAFIWLAPFMLHEQSLRSLRQVLGSAQKLTERDAFASAKFIERNEVVFLNWASLNKNEANLIKGSESRAEFRQICQATHDRGRQIVVIIDESHHSSSTKIAREIKEMIEPDVILEMSATPDISSLTTRYEVPRGEVVDAGLIKKSARINAGVAGDKTYSAEKLDELLLDLAVAKRAELARAFNAEGVDVNPLLLVQVPDAKAGDDVIAAVEERLERKHSITYASGRLARWLSGDASYEPDAPELIDNDGSVDVLIFKQAIATGWDCPRAHVLLKLRDPGASGKFEVQTIGRIMRMPERKHYDTDELNEAFVYHPHEDYKPAEDFAIVTRTAAWKTGLAKPTLRATWFVRGDTPYLEAADAKAIAAGVLAKLKIDPAGKPSANKGKLTRAGFNTTAEPDHTLAEAILDGEDDRDVEKLGDLRVGLPAKLVERVFHRLLQRWIGVANNPELVAEGLYKTCQSAVGFTIPETQAFFVANAHNLDQEFMVAVDDVSPRSSRSTRKKLSAEWQPLDPRPYNTEVGKDLKHEEVTDLDGYAYEPCFLAAARSQPEGLFENWLSDHTGTKVSWWMKNGERPSQDFSITYSFRGSEHNFFPDYIAALADGRIALYETKDVTEAFADEQDIEYQRNVAKMEALRAWVAEDPSARDAAFIVVAQGSRGLRWGRDEAPVKDAGHKMLDLL